MTVLLFLRIFKVFKLRLYAPPPRLIARHFTKILCQHELANFFNKFFKSLNFKRFLKCVMLLQRHKTFFFLDLILLKRGSFFETLVKVHIRRTFKTFILLIKQNTLLKEKMEIPFLFLVNPGMKSKNNTLLYCNTIIVIYKQREEFH